MAGVQPKRERLLPIDSYPMTAHLFIEPKKDDTFYGELVTNIRTRFPTDKLTFNASELDVIRAEYSSPDDFPCDVSDSIVMIEEAQQMTITLDRHFQALKTIQVKFCFKGLITENEAGLHKTRTADGFMLSTSLDGSNARKLFPCYDEPTYMASFSLRLKVSNGVTCISNMPLETTADLEGSKEFKFVQTQKISPHLMAFAIGDFKKKTFPDSDITVYTPQGFDPEKGYRASVHAMKAIKYYNEWLGGPDVFLEAKKFNFLAVPDATKVTATLGLIMLPPRKLLYEVRTPGEDVPRIIYAACNAIAQQWFGNLVQVKSWKDLWFLNALADYATVKCVLSMGSADGDWNAWSDMLVDNFQPALFMDSFKSMSSVRKSFTNPYGIRANLDHVTRSKTCATLRMIGTGTRQPALDTSIRHFVRESSGKGLSVYNFSWHLDFKFKSQYARRFIEDWTEFSGYPVIDVKQNLVQANLQRIQASREDSSSNDNLIMAGRSMERFLLASENEIPVSGYPLAFIGFESDANLSIEKISDKFWANGETIEHATDLALLAKNTNIFQFVRTAYDEHIWGMVNTNLSQGQMTPESRAILISDTAAFAYCGHGCYNMEKLLSLLKLFGTEDNYYVWRTIFAVMDELQTVLVYKDEKAAKALDTFRESLIKSSLAANPLRVLNSRFHQMVGLSTYRERLESLLMLNSRHKSFIDISKILVDDHDKIISVDRFRVLQLGAYKICLKVKDSEVRKRTYHKLYHKVAQPLGPSSIIEPEIRYAILQSLGFAETHALIKMTYKLAARKDLLSKDEAIAVLEPLTTHRQGRWYLWRKFFTKSFFKDFSWLDKRRTFNLLSKILNCFWRPAERFSAKRFFQFLDAQTKEEFQPEFDQIIQYMGVKRGMIERDYANVEKFLKENGFWPGEEHRVEQPQQGFTGVREIDNFLADMLQRSLIFASRA